MGQGDGTMSKKYMQCEPRKLSLNLKTNEKMLKELYRRPLISTCAHSLPTYIFMHTQQHSF